MAKLSANSGDTDQTPHSAASDLGLHSLPITLSGVSRLQWINEYSKCPKISITLFLTFLAKPLLCMQLFLKEYRRSHLYGEIQLKVREAFNFRYFLSNFSPDTKKVMGS